MSVRPLRVAVLSRYPVMRAGLAALLDEHPARVAVAASASHEGPLGYDVAIYDLGSEIDAAAMEDLEKLIAGGPPVVALKPVGRFDLGQRALDAGVVDVLATSITAAELIDALGHAVAGRSPTPEKQTLRQVQAFANCHRLTPREAEILLLIASGCSNQEIADALYLTINTIKSCIRTAYKKIGATSRSQAVLWVCQNDKSGQALIYQTEPA